MPINSAESAPQLNVLNERLNTCDRIFSGDSCLFVPADSVLARATPNAKTVKQKMAELYDMDPRKASSLKRFRNLVLLKSHPDKTAAGQQPGSDFQKRANDLFQRQEKLLTGALSEHWNDVILYKSGASEQSIAPNLSENVSGNQQSQSANGEAEASSTRPMSFDPFAPSQSVKDAPSDTEASAKPESEQTHAENSSNSSSGVSIAFDFFTRFTENTEKAAETATPAKEGAGDEATVEKASPEEAQEQSHSSQQSSAEEADLIDLFADLASSESGSDKVQSETAPSVASSTNEKQAVPNQEAGQQSSENLLNDFFGSQTDEKATSSTSSFLDDVFGLFTPQPQKQAAQSAPQNDIFDIFER